MTHSKLLNKFSDYNFVKKTIELLENNEASFGVKILFGAAKSLFVASLLQKISNKKFVLLASNNEAQSVFIDDLNLLLDKKNQIFNFYYSHKNTNVKLENNTSIVELIDSVARFQKSNNAIAVATSDVFNTLIPHSDNVQHHFCYLKTKQFLDIQQFTTELSLNGFQKEQYVARAGEYAVRGGIIDIFAPNMSDPIRVELWGDEIDSIRIFDVLSQRSKLEVDEISFIDSMFVSEESDLWTSIFEYFSSDTIFIIDTPDAIDFNTEGLSELKKFRKINLNPLGKTEIEVNTTPQPKFNSSVQKFVSELKKYQELKLNTFVAADGDIHLDRLKDLIESQTTLDNTGFEDDINLDFDADIIIKNTNWLNTALSSGFSLLNERLVYIVENEIFSRIRNSKTNKINKAKGITLKELKQLNIGDYLVHEDKGIGKFAGFQAIEMGNTKQDCLKMLFADDDILYVHLNYLHKVQKYSAAEGILPRLTKLGSAEWLKKKDKTKKKLKDIARDLIMLYAKRKMQKGFAYPQDTTWQKEFEASFIYEDTIDQVNTTLEVKKDMETDTPMDRLVCGDVGFGKTEIAIRAAFKAANAGKQTAVLVPTTILAEQHFQTFRERISRYPISVEAISRFRNRAEQKEIIQKLKEKKIDILIGTHRLLSNDIQFSDLGLLIIDEEHRFGVGAKEKLRQLKANIDTLTLTATPIPRTLNFSLMGARDLSQMETPPRNRLAVETEIEEWDINFISQKITEEIKRKGQVFIVNDKIEGLEKMQMDLQMTLPNIRFSIIHARMQPALIEDLMQKFIEKKYDVMLSTKIIESGIDIPNANTIIINNAQNFGLAELYQLRGRVGRSTTQAYCYLMIPSFSRIPSKALRRLLAIEEFSDLGSGLQLALRDLEIRGSGDLLGAEQSGFITEIGFDLYQKVLEEAVNELKKEEFSDLFKEEINDMPRFNNDEINIDIENEAYFPQTFIPDDTERFNYYKKLFEANDNKKLHDIKNELKDRFGKLPPEVLELLKVVRIRIAATNTGFTRIQIRANEFLIEFPSSSNKEYYEKVFPIVLDIVNGIEGFQLSQEKEKLVLTKNISDDLLSSQTNIDIAIDFLWKIKKNIEMSF
ncbi:MAG: transcription-repair coupling factor [Bacteroidetes bacterium]|nr:transcription-repair coupling factor [Bacteroidota bacterium]